MKKIVMLSLAGIFFFCGSALAQRVNTDSLKLVAQISQDQLKLGKLQNLIDQKIKNKQDAATNAQTSANENSTAADKLTGDPDDKKLAKQAASKASDAKSDAKKARKESARLDDLNKSIMDLKGKIASEQAKLSTYYSTQPAEPLPISAPMSSDTIRRN